MKILTESNMFSNLLFGPCRLIWLLSKVGHLSKRETHFPCIFPENSASPCSTAVYSAFVAFGQGKPQKENAYGRTFLLLKDVASILGKTLLDWEVSFLRAITLHQTFQTSTFAPGTSQKCW